MHIAAKDLEPGVRVLSCDGHDYVPAPAIAVAPGTERAYTEITLEGRVGTIEVGNHARVTLAGATEATEAT